MAVTKGKSVKVAPKVNKDIHTGNNAMFLAMKFS
jgi:hypothetical protein